MDERIKGLADLLKNKVEKIAKEAEVEKYLGDNKVVLLVSKTEVKSKIAEPLVRSKKAPRIASEVLEKIRKAKKAFKGNLDIMNLVVLLVRVKEELKKIKFGSLDAERKKMIRVELEEVDAQIRGQMPLIGR